MQPEGDALDEVTQIIGSTNLIYLITGRTSCTTNSDCPAVCVVGRGAGVALGLRQGVGGISINNGAVDLDPLYMSITLSP